jgi:exopolysaccharide biosynthesis WecB/TagA/CpsF family protein
MVGVPVDLLESNDALDIIAWRATSDLPVLKVVSVNLDHVHHFGTGGRWHGCLDDTDDWLYLIDGSPVAKEAARRTGQSYPRLAGSDLAPAILDICESRGLRVGFLGGSPDNHLRLKSRLSAERPRLTVAGLWSPSREELSSSAASGCLADEIAAATVDVLFVGLGKPRQELWIANFGARTGSRVVLGFGAVVDFLAGDRQRAPRILSQLGLEWAWRLLLEPRRLANRYLVEGPVAYLRLRTDRSTTTRGHRSSQAQRGATGVIVVTHNSAADVHRLLTDIRRELVSQPTELIVVDNDSNDDTVSVIGEVASEATLVRAQGNLGYAAAINLGLGELSDDVTTVVVLNPDLRLRPGGLDALRSRLEKSGAAVVAPQIVDPSGDRYPSIKFEPTISRALGAAVFGSRIFPGRPTWLSTVEYNEESYRHAHPVHWTTGAALMFRRDVIDRIGLWDESFFLYSEETDFCRRVRDAGLSIWYEPAAVVEHIGGGSGRSIDLDVLQEVNKLRFARKHRPRWYAELFRMTVALHHLLRCRCAANRTALMALLDESRWAALPHAISRRPPPAGGGSVVIPAHNEASVLGRLLDELHPLASDGIVEIVVACNGCDDGTEQVAGAYDGVKLVQLATASKTAALNLADEIATRWPRLYVDADIEISRMTVLETLEELRTTDVFAGRPVFRYDMDEASWAVRAFYRARSRIASTSRALWGAGVYGVTRSGHERIQPFPAVVADDLYVDEQFAVGEKAVFATPPVVVRTPRTAAALLATLARVQRGRASLPDGVAPSQGSATTAGELVRSIRGPRSATDALVYTGFVLAARLRSRSAASPRWERDESSRVAAPPRPTRAEALAITRGVVDLPDHRSEQLVGDATSAQS